MKEEAHLEIVPAGIGGFRIPVLLSVYCRRYVLPTEKDDPHRVHEDFPEVITAAIVAINRLLCKGSPYLVQVKSGQAVLFYMFGCLAEVIFLA